MDKLQLTIVEFDGTEHRLEASDGESVMQAAVNASVAGILADCGGACICATCHCYVDAPWVDRVTPASANERDLIDFAIDPKDNSRLSCQLKMNAQCDGLVVRLPRAQA